MTGYKSMVDLAEFGIENGREIFRPFDSLVICHCNLCILIIPFLSNGRLTRCDFVACNLFTTKKVVGS